LGKYGAFIIEWTGCEDYISNAIRFLIREIFPGYPQDITEQTPLLFEAPLPQSPVIENSDSPTCYRTDIDSALESLQQWKGNIRIIQQQIPNVVSSTKIRLFLRRVMSVQYLTPTPVIEYIEQHSLYQEEDVSSVGGKE
jgi:hypothetical protein